MPSASSVLGNLLPNAGIWKRNSGAFAKAPILRSINDPSYGIYFYDDFTHLPTGKYTVTQATTGTFTISPSLAGGIALADCASSTATQGVNVQLADVFARPIAGTTLYFEAKVKATDIGTGPEFFLGLASADTTIIATSANSSTNHIGWQSVTDDNVLLFSAENSGTGATKASTTLVEDTWVTLGFKVNGITDVEHYVDGVKQSTTHVTANIPVTGLAPSLVCQSNGTTDPIVQIDYWRVLQTK